jgi:hypothetical protein
MSKLCDNVDQNDCDPFGHLKMCKCVEIECSEGNTCKLCCLYGCPKYPTKEETE